MPMERSMQVKMEFIEASKNASADEFIQESIKWIRYRYR